MFCKTVPKGRLDELNFDEGYNDSFNTVAFHARLPSIHDHPLCDRFAAQATSFRLDHAGGMKRDTFTVPLGLESAPIIDNFVGDSREASLVFQKLVYGPFTNARTIGLAVMQAQNGLAFLKAIRLVHLIKGIDKAANLHLKFIKTNADRHVSPPKNSHGTRLFRTDAGLIPFVIRISKPFADWSMFLLAVMSAARINAFLEVIGDIASVNV
jgi:hypothetical protein